MTTRRALSLLLLLVIVFASPTLVITAQDKSGVTVTEKDLTGSFHNLSYYRRVITSKMVAQPDSAQYEVRFTLRANTIERCNYTSSRQVARRTMALTVEILDLTTRKIVASRIFTGGLPAKCNRTEIFKGGIHVKNKDGSMPNATTAGTWLKQALAKQGLK